MSNKIKDAFRLKNVYLKINTSEYSFFSESKKEILFNLILPREILFKKTLPKNSLKITVGKKKIRVKKKLKKKLGFFSTFLKGSLNLKKKIIVRRIFLVGTGFKVFKSRQKWGNALIFKIGLSHLVKISVPTGISFKVLKFNEIKFYSLFKELLGSFLNFAASIRFPDSYKGRGLLISNKPKIKFKRGKIKN